MSSCDGEWPSSAPLNQLGTVSALTTFRPVWATLRKDHSGSCRHATRTPARERAISHVVVRNIFACDITPCCKAIGSHGRRGFTGACRIRGGHYLPVVVMLKAFLRTQRWLFQ